MLVYCHHPDALHFHPAIHFVCYENHRKNHDPALLTAFQAKKMLVLLTWYLEETSTVAHMQRCPFSHQLFVFSQCLCLFSCNSKPKLCKVSQNTVEIIRHAWKDIPFSCCKALHTLRLQQVPFTLVRALCVHSLHWCPCCTYAISMKMHYHNQTMLNIAGIQCCMIFLTFFAPRSSWYLGTALQNMFFFALVAHFSCKNIRENNAQLAFREEFITISLG